MSDMVERVARAMFDATAFVNERWNDDPDSPQRKYFDRIARAAIDAMREPTLEMLEVAVCGPADAIPRWHAMIDAALASRETR